MTNSTLSHSDRPNLIRVEGQAIELKFDRLSPTRGRVTWNIPSPANGCDAGTQAYNGIVVTGSTMPSNQTTSPVNGQFYSGDPTMGADTHAGDKIGHAYVVEAVYNDLTTTFVDVDGLDPNKPYYFSAYAVDNVLTYFRSGVHAYSTTLANGVDVPPDHPAVHGFTLNGLSISQASATPTGLNPAQNYSLSVETACGTHTVTVTGADAQTYSQLVRALNIAAAKLNNPLLSHQPPNTGALYLNGGRLQRWNGASYTPISLLISSTLDPMVLPDDTLWYTSSTSTLLKRELGVWEEQSFIEYGADPTAAQCGVYLFNGTTAYAHNGSGWCEAQTFVQTTNPFVPVDTKCSFYWYDTTNQGLKKRVDGAWVGVSAIYTHVDPNAVPEDFYWFDTSRQRAYRRQAGAWINAGNIVVGDSNAAAVRNPTGGLLWYDPTTQLLQRRTMLNTEWVTLSSVTYHTDPTIRVSCEDRWWDSATDILKSWDELNGIWTPVDRFEVQDFDPMAGVVVADDAVWWNPVTQELITWNGPCDPVSVIHWAGGDPSNIPDGTYWRNTTTGRFYERVGGTWVLVDVIEFITDPTSLPLGTFWLSGTTLRQWNGSEWIEVAYSTTSHVPTVGTKWFNLSTDTLYEWNGAWIESQGPFIVTVYEESVGECKVCDNGSPYPGVERSGVYFISTARGSRACLIIKDITLLAGLTHSTTIFRATPGSDGVDPLPPYLQTGVGTDDSEEERRVIARDVVLALGGSQVNIELSKEDLDHSIDRALRELRRLASPYTRGYFPFTVTKTDQKRWLLTNKQLGHNKIVRVLGVFRATGLWPTSPTAGINNFTQPWLYGMMAGAPGGSMLTYHLLATYVEELDTLLARKITYFFNERTRLLEIHNRLASGENLLVEASVEMTEQDIMMDRMYRPWIERWATAEARMKLAEIRGKFQTIPGPAGGTVMNGAELRQAAQAEFEALRKEVDDFLVQDLTQFPGALFTIG